MFRLKSQHFESQPKWNQRLRKDSSVHRGWKAKTNSRGISWFASRNLYTPQTAYLRYVGFNKIDKNHLPSFYHDFLTLYWLRKQFETDNCSHSFGDTEVSAPSDHRASNLRFYKTASLSFYYPITKNHLQLYIQRIADYGGRMNQILLYSMLDTALYKVRHFCILFHLHSSFCSTQTRT